MEQFLLWGNHVHPRLSEKPRQLAQATTREKASASNDPSWAGRPLPQPDFREVPCVPLPAHGPQALPLGQAASLIWSFYGVETDWRAGLGPFWGHLDPMNKQQPKRTSENLTPTTPPSLVQGHPGLAPC